MPLSRRTMLKAAIGAAAAAPVAGALHPARRAVAATEANDPRRAVTPGATVLAAEGYARLAGARVGLVSNPTGVLPDLSHEVDLMAADDRVDLVAVFGPEHGFRGSAQAGGSEGTSIDPRTGITVYDAYGASATRLAELFTASGVDVVLFDIQDVGARFYTYIWTMYDAMVAAARTGLRFVVLDRPNPVGGLAYGPMMTPRFATFVGKKEIVQQHGMTVGELARLFNGEFLATDAGRTVELDVVSVDGWRRDMMFPATGLPWVLPSPNMPTPDTALVYPGTCLFEGTNLSEGRGTTKPFELIGAPYADWHWSDALNALGLPGVRFREGYFTPTFSKYRGETCNGVEVQVTAPAVFDPIKSAAAMLVTAKQLYGSSFAWRQDSWDVERPYWVDKLSGSTRLREMVDAGAGVDEVVVAWDAELDAFRTRREQYLLYRGPASVDAS